MGIVSGNSTKRNRTLEVSVTFTPGRKYSVIKLKTPENKAASET